MNPCAVHPHRRHLLAACRALPQPEAVASLTLDGGALNPGNAESIADTFPGLRSIDIAAAYDKDAEDGVVSGAVRLLTRCGPRLNHLKLSVCGWTPPCLVHLRSCTALTTLDLRMADLSTAQPNEGGICQRGGYALPCLAGPPFCHLYAAFSRSPPSSRPRSLGPFAVQMLP